MSLSVYPNPSSNELLPNEFNLTLSYILDWLNLPPIPKLPESLSTWISDSSPEPQSLSLNNPKSKKLESASPANLALDEAGKTQQQSQRARYLKFKLRQQIQDLKHKLKLPSTSFSELTDSNFDSTDSQVQLRSDSAATRLSLSESTHSIHKLNQNQTQTDRLQLNTSFFFSDTFLPNLSTQQIQQTKFGNHTTKTTQTSFFLPILPNLSTESSPKPLHTSFFLPFLPGLSTLAAGPPGLPISQMIKSGVNNSIIAVPRMLGLIKDTRYGNEGLAALRDGPSYNDSSGAWFRYSGKGDYQYPSGLFFKYLVDRGYGKSVIQRSYRIKKCNTGEECRKRCYKELGQRVSNPKIMKYYQQKREKILEKIHRVRMNSIGLGSGSGAVGANGAGGYYDTKLLKLKKQLDIEDRERVNSMRRYRACLQEVNRREQMAQKFYYQYLLGLLPPPCKGLSCKKRGLFTKPGSTNPLTKAWNTMLNANRKSGLMHWGTSEIKRTNEELKSLMRVREKELKVTRDDREKYSKDMEEMEDDILRMKKLSNNASNMVT